jgi:hypothetical protein
MENTTINTICISFANLFLQIANQPMNLDFITILDKMTTIGILMYISITLNKKIEIMTENFREEEKEIRASFKDDLKLLNESFDKRLLLLLENIKK